MKIMFWFLHLLVTFGAPAVGFYFSYPQHPVVAFVVTALSVYAGCFFFMLSYARYRFNLASNDAAVFATVVRQLWKDDPILATAVWKKAVPHLIPPWHDPRRQEG